MAYRPAIASMSLGRAWVHSIEEKFKQAAGYGFEGLEIFYEDLEYIAKSLPGGLTVSNELQAARNIRELCDQHCLKIIVLQPFAFYEGLRDRGQHAQRIQKLRVWFQIAKILGTDIVQIPTNFLPAAEITPDINTIVEDMIELAELGLQQTPVIRFAYEGLAWGTFYDTWEATWDIISKVNRPNFGMCLDTFHIAGRVWADPTAESGKTPNADTDLSQSLARLVETVDVAKVFYVQVADGERLDSPLTSDHEMHVVGQPARMTWSRNCRRFAYESEGYLPVIEVCRSIFRGLGYTGWVSMELFSKSMVNPDPDTPREHARRGAESWAKLCLEINLARDIKSIEVLQNGLHTAGVINGGQIDHNVRVPTVTHPTPPERRTLWLFGQPVAHSVSPIFHNLVFQKLGLPWRYIRLESRDPEDLRWVMQQDDFIGAAITMPNKIDFVNRVDLLTEPARIIGAINTIYVREAVDSTSNEGFDGNSRSRTYIGTNTDWIGIRDALLHKNPDLRRQLNNGPGLVIGGGATSRSAIYALTQGLGARVVYIINRDVAEVQNVIQGLASAGLRETLKHLATIEEAQKLVDTPTAVVSAVPDHPPVSEVEKTARSVTEIMLRKMQAQNSREGQEHGVFLEMSYDPSPRTELVELAAKYGWDIVTGIDMMVYGVIQQDMLWTERPIGELAFEEGYAAIRKALKLR